MRDAFGPFGRLRLRPSGKRRAPRRYSLHVSVASLFTLLIVALGTVLIVHGYERHRVLALGNAAELFSEVARNAAGAAGELYAPVKALIEQTARLDAVGSSVDELPLSLDYFAESLASNTQLDAIYVGFDNGDFYLVRKLAEDPDAHAALAAPDDTVYVVQRIERDRFEQPRYVTSYHDADLRLLGLNGEFVTGFDPRSRQWYRDAIDSNGTIVTDFYRFFTSGEIGTTLARRMRDGGAVIGADLKLETISRQLGSPSLPATARMVLFTETGEIVGYSDAAWLERRTREAVRGQVRSPQVGDIEEPEIGALFERFVEGERGGRMTIDAGRGPWFGSIVPIDFGAHEAGGVYAAILVPESELLAGQLAVRLHSVVLSLCALAVAVALAWWLSASISRSTAALAREALRIRRLQLDGPVVARSRIAEIDHLACAMDTMKSSLQRFVALTDATGGELDVDALAALAIEHIVPVCGASGAAVLLLSDDGRRLVRVGEGYAIDPHTGQATVSDYRSDAVALPEPPLHGRPLRPDQHAALYGESVLIEDTAASTTHDTTGYHSRSVLVVPLRARHGETIGVIHLGDPGRLGVGHTNADAAIFVEALTAHVGLAFENQRLTEARRTSFEALIRMLAQAIDAKSPHTGKHCQRVPILCTLLAEAASESALPAFRDYTLTEAGRDELDVASWLHDCGKVTTPDHIVDKATKLETVHNRIHEIRTRFEVLWRDAEIECLRTLLHDPDADPATARWRRDETQARLLDDFTFIARCNVGTESMDIGDVRRVKELAERTWARHFDDSLGLSGAELAQRESLPATRLPASEPLLADKPYHRVPRGHGNHPWGENPFDFDMEVPSNESDDGEIHNLTIARGTLNAEERFRVNDHVVQTIEMLEAIPFPRELARVPRIAGNHHERLDGSGYPRRRTAEGLGIEDRILSIADVFEALTAADRPYRTARTMEGSIAIMRGMCDSGELCPDLFELFVARKLHLAYAERLRHPISTDAVELRRPERANRTEISHDAD